MSQHSGKVSGSEIWLAIWFRRQRPKAVDSKTEATLQPKLESEGEEKESESEPK